ncbi:MAG TPA: helix-turn-helix domain-containing protein [Microlunatus sp.]|nr:helix-turn-helix domain-containing protein [Microlunatus sp.]
MGLRQQKKEQTRQRLTETAWRLADERGFDRVTVAEIAQAAGVSEATLFNYFRTKEDLFYAPLETFGERLVEAVRSRAPGVSALAAVRDFLLGGDGLLAGPGEERQTRDRLRGQLRVITDSPALLAREQQAFAHYTEQLAAVLGESEETDPITAAVVAHALIGVHRSLVAHVRHRILAGAPLRRVAAEVREHGDRAFGLLEDGLGRYGVAR